MSFPVTLEPWRKEAIGRPSLRQEDDGKMGLQAKGWERVE